MTKKEIVATLTEKGIDFDESMTGAELMAAHPDVLADLGAKAAVNKDGVIEIKYRDANVKGGYSVRVFSLDAHGEDFESLAKEFAETNKNIIIE